MIDSIYVATSGLNGHQKGLKVISNNVANMNTPGFKGSQTQFADVFLSQGGDSSLGEQTNPGGGMTTLTPTLTFSDGEIRQTGRDMDMALNGPGFFVVQDNRGDTLYTKSGRFEVNASGDLVTLDKGFKVMSLAGGGLAPVSTNNFKISRSVVSSQIALSGNLSSTGTTHTIASVKVYDSLGGLHDVKLQFDLKTVTDPATSTTSTVPGTWVVKVLEGAMELGTGEVKLALSRPDPTADRMTFNIKAADNVQTAITVLLGDQITGDSSGTTSTVVVQKVDGNAMGTLTKTAVDETGTLVFTYSNTLTTKGPQLAIAEFVTPDVLSAETGSYFKLGRDDSVRLLAVGTSTKLVSGSLELSNVDLTDQFSTMILVQRGFQASSQVLSTANEMIQTLYDMKGRR
jgi:flagellar hook protein FlgE